MPFHNDETSGDDDHCHPQFEVLDVGERYPGVGRLVHGGVARPLILVMIVQSNDDDNAEVQARGTSWRLSRPGIDGNRACVMLTRDFLPSTYRMPPLTLVDLG